jgi:hypothetical protein
MLLLNNKSTNEVFLAPFWYVNVKLEVGEPTSLAMLELVTRLRTSSTTREPIKCFTKVLNGTHVTCGSRIGRGPDVVFRVSFNIIIMSLVLSFKFWKLNNNVLTSFYAISRIWSWHSISWSMENCMFSLCTCTFGPREFDALVACGVVVCSPLANKVRSSSLLRGWKDCSNSPYTGNRTWTKCESISLNYLPSGRNFGCHTNLLCRKVGRVKKNGKFWCETRIMCTGKNILPNHGVVWEVIEWPTRSLPWSWTLYRLGMTSWWGRLAL